MSLAQRIKELRKARGWTQRELAERAKVSHPAVCQWEIGKNEPSGENLRLLSAVFQTSLIDLDDTQQRSGRVPLLAAHEFATLQTCDGSKRETIEPTAIPKGEAFAFRMPDKAMTPRVEPGDLVVVDPGLTPAPSDLIAFDGPAGMSVRRLRLVDLDDGSLFELIAENDDYPRIRTHRSIDILGVVVETRRIWRCGGPKSR